MDCNLDRIAQIQDMPARAVRRYIKRNEVTMPRYLARTHNGTPYVVDRFSHFEVYREFATLGEAVTFAARLNACRCET